MIINYKTAESVTFYEKYIATTDNCRKYFFVQYFIVSLPHIWKQRFAIKNLSLLFKIFFNYHQYCILNSFSTSWQWLFNSLLWRVIIQQILLYNLGKHRLVYQLHSTINKLRLSLCLKSDSRTKYYWAVSFDSPTTNSQHWASSDCKTTMEHKVAFITGGARGLGRAIGEALLNKGLKVRCVLVVKVTRTKGKMRIYDTLVHVRHCI